MRKVSILAACASVLLSSCVGPNFERPEAPAAATAYTAEPIPEVTESADIPGGAAQRFLAGQDVPGQWWRLFKSDALNRMVDQAVKGNSSLAAAHATLRQAHYIKMAQIGTFLPSIDAQATVQRAKSFQPFLGASTATTYGGAVGFSWVLDIFGGNRRQFEALGAQEDYYYFQVQGTYLNLVSNVIIAAIDEASLRAQIAVTNDIIKSQTQELELLNQQYELGAVAKGDVLAQQTQLAQTMATLPPLEKQLAQVRNSLTVLLGRLPVQGNVEEISFDTISLPTDIPLSVPAKLVNQRPDVRASEALMHQASAQVGVATAAMFPQFQITGNYSSSAASFGDLFTTSPSNITWGLLGAITQPIFRGGTLWYQRRSAQAAYDNASEQYRNTVLTAFSDVATALKTLELDAQALKIQLVAERSARENFEITRERFRAGAISYLSMLDAERVEQQARLLLVQAQAARFADTVLLFQALGGGWWNRDYKPPMTESEAREQAAERDAAPVPVPPPPPTPSARPATTPTPPNATPNATPGVTPNATPAETPAETPGATPPAQGAPTPIQPQGGGGSTQNSPRAEAPRTMEWSALPAAPAGSGVELSAGVSRTSTPIASDAGTPPVGRTSTPIAPDAATSPGPADGAGTH
jgi:NodT family efflux transporter outer membrane factor (OMF) lipoprotein